MTPDERRHKKLNSTVRGLCGGGGYADNRSTWLDPIDSARPVEQITTQEVAVRFRKIQTYGGGETDYSPHKTPYMREIHDAMDDFRIRMVAVKGPARSGKTLGAENFLLKIGQFGPSRNVLWYMHSEPDVKRYVKERVDWFLRHHVDLAPKVSRQPGANAWNMKLVDGALWEWLAANAATTRARSAALIVGDEIDAMRPDIRDAIEILIENRQREYGHLAKAFLCSHPDAGPQFGIDKILQDTDRRIRIWLCPECGHLACPAAEAPKGRRMHWNVPVLFDQAQEMPRDEMLDYVSENARIVCPNCKSMFDDGDRLEIDSSASWMGKGQFIADNERIEGEPVQMEKAGFIIHAFMAPFVTLAGLAKEWASAFQQKVNTGVDRGLKEVYVKSLGETYRGDDEASQPKEWEVIKARLVNTSYQLGQIPRGVQFLTAMVDVQGNRFECGVIGWSRNRESWLIDRFSIKQRLGLVDINPAANLQDWDVIEKAVLAQIYPLMDDSGRFMSIGKLTVDTGGEAGVTNNARQWAANLFSREKNPIPAWRVLLSKGDRWKEGEMYGTPRLVSKDEAERDLAVPIVERTVNVHEVKRLISWRMERMNPGPNFMHLPRDLDDKYIRELCAEVLVNDEWVLSGTSRNETWDIYVGAEVARGNLAPDNVNIDWDSDPPIWAMPFIPSPTEEEDDNDTAELDFFGRLSKLNRGE